MKKILAVLGVFGLLLAGLLMLRAELVQRQLADEARQADERALRMESELADLGKATAHAEQARAESARKLAALEAQVEAGSAAAAVSLQHVALLESELTKLQYLRNQPPIRFAAGAGPQFTGEQHFQLYARLKEDAIDWSTSSIPANTWTSIYVMPTPTAGDLNVYAALAIISYDNADATVNCDAGACDGVIRRYVPGRFQGGDFCRPDGVCASADAGGFDVQEDSYVTGSGIMTGAQARIAWISSTLTLQVMCPATCRAAGGISGQRMKMFVPASVDSGTDSGTDSGVDSGTDSGVDAGGGPAPSILSITPLATTSAGGWVHQIKVASGTCTGTPSATFAGVAATSVTCTTTSNLQATSPAFSTPNGSGTEQVLTVTAGGTTYTSASFAVSGAVSAAGAIKLTTAANNFVTGATVTVANVGGTVEANGTWPITVVDTTHFTLTGSTFANAYTSGGTAAQGVFERPSNLAIAAYHAGMTLAGGAWSTWADSSGHSKTLTSTGSPVTMVLNGSTAPLFDHTSAQWATLGSGLCGISPISISAVVFMNSLSGVASAVTSYSAGAGLYIGEYSTGNVGIASDINFANIITSTPVAAGAAYFVGAVNNGASSYAQVSAVVTTGTLTTITVAPTDYTVATVTPVASSQWTNGAVTEVVARCAAESQTDMNVDYLISKAITGAQ